MNRVDLISVAKEEVMAHDDKSGPSDWFAREVVPLAFILLFILIMVYLGITGH